MANQAPHFPASFLYQIIVDVNTNNPSNSPKYIKNIRRRQRDIYSSESEDENMSLTTSLDLEDDTDESLDHSLQDTSGQEESLAAEIESIEDDADDHKIEENPRKNILLTEKDLRNDAWLTDIEITEFLLRIREYFESQNTAYFGLNDPIVLAGLRIGNINMRAENFVEVLNSSRNHWVCVAGGLAFPNQDICLFDSMTRSSIDPQLGTTCSLIVVPTRLAKGNLIFRIQKVGKQRRSFCGYYALANAMAICLGLDPEQLIFDELQLREHFINIIHHNQPMSMFPYNLKKRVNNTNHKNLIFDLSRVELTDRQYYLD